MNKYLASASAVLLLAVAACEGKQDGAVAAPAGSALTSAAATPAMLAAGAAAAPPAEDLFAFAAGARFVQAPDDTSYSDMAYGPYNLIDETPTTDVRTAVGRPAAFVLELPEQTAITRIVFDNGGLTNPDKSVREFKVEVSDASATSGFQTVLSFSLKKDVNDQVFDLPAKPVGRWVRLTLLTNHGAEENFGLTGFSGYGQQLTRSAAIANVSGTYAGASGWGPVHLKQEGTRVIGCYQYRDGVIAGGVEGRLLKAEMIEQVSGGGVAKAMGLFTFTPDGKTLFGMSRDADTSIEGYNAFWSAEKESSDIGDCPGVPGWRGGGAAGSQMSKELESSGRARLDGVNFDFNSAVILPASHALLDQVAEMLREHEDWKINLEGHTDNIGGPAFNKGLSAQRAAAVQAYLISKGVTAGRLSSAGFGFDKPVAPNDTQGGRAQNRRVEIVKL